MKSPHPVALFRLSVLGSLISAQLQRGELQRELQRLARRHYDIPHSCRTTISAKTIEGWYYCYLRDGLDGLAPRKRTDKGVSKLSHALQQEIIEAKQANRKRSIRQLVRLLEQRGSVAKGTLSRSAIHRLLQHHGLSAAGSETEPVEHRSFAAEYAGDIWYGDVMHAPTVLIQQRLRKAYLVSLMDDASRLITHSAFCPGETALDIEGVLKQAVLKRGLPRKLVLDNGAAYRSLSLQGICARLGIALVYCRPYAPEGKGKLERWHRTVRAQFLSEIDTSTVTIEQLNSRWWAWVEQHYHTATHSALQCSPIVRYQQDVSRIRGLGNKAARLDALFYHQVERKVRKDGSVRYEGRYFEVDYSLCGKTIVLVVNPQSQEVVQAEDSDGNFLCQVVEQDKVANTHRRRHRKEKQITTTAPSDRGPSAIDLAVKKHYGKDSEQ